MRRWAGLWAPHRQRRWLSGVTIGPTDDDGQNVEKVVTDESEIARALARFWAGRFATPVIDDRLARAIARTFVPPIPQQKWPVPKISDVGKALRVAKPTSVGPDGVPYTAWRYASHEAYVILHRLFINMATTGVAPCGHNDAVGVFPPKGTAANDVDGGTGLTRAPGATRPLSLKNTDRKTIARMVNAPLTQALRQWVPVPKQGFVAGRGAAEHVVLLDAKA